MARSATVLAFPDKMADRLRGAGLPPEDDDPLQGHKGLPLEKLKSHYRSFLDSKPDEIEEMAEARRYYSGRQWTDEEIKKLEARNQPVVTYNRIGRKINAVCGLIEKLKQDPEAYPRTPSPGAEDGAELATQVLEYVCDTADFDNLSAEASRQSAIGGIGGVELVLIQGDQGDPDIDLELLDQREFFYQPNSTKHDFRDARFMGTSKWMDLDEAQELWPDYSDELEGYVERDSQGDQVWRGDERTPLWWTDYAKKRIRIVDHWYKSGNTWIYCIYCGECILEQGVSPFVNEKGQSISKYLAFSCNVDHRNRRYGFFRDLKSPQDEINHRRSKGLHLLNTRRLIGEVGAFDDVEVARREMARPDGMVLKNKGYEVEVDNTRPDFEGNLEMLKEAKDEMDSFGPNAQLMGQAIEGMNPQVSGRAIALLQAAGIAELGPYILAWKRWKLRVYRAIWNAVQQFWTQERWIRITDNQDMQQFIQVNGWQLDQFGRPQMINQLAALDVDIIIGEGPDTINSMAEAYETLIGLAQQGAQIPPQVMIELSSLPSSVKKKVLAQFQQQQQDPQSQAAIQLKMQQEQAKLGKTQSETVLNQAKAQQAMRPEEGPGQQIDTPADTAKAQLDTAKAHQIALDTAHKAARGPGADEAHQIGQAREQQAHEAAMAAATGGPQPKTIQELMALAAKARLANIQADRVQAEIDNPTAFHPPPKGKT